MKRRLVVAGLAVALDLVAGELPNRWHPVAWFGRMVGFVERRLPKATESQRWISGFALVGLGVGSAIVTALGVRRVARWLPRPLGILVEAVALKQAFAARALFEHTRAVEEALACDDLAEARRVASYMVSRETGDLPAGLVASAAIESLTENSSDSVVAPLAWYFVLGLPAAFAYRASNTLDAIVGYHSKGRLGTPSARFDDVLNFAPARCTGLLIALASGRVGRWSAIATDARTTPSPNAGWPMAAAAHGLGVVLEKREHHVLNPHGAEPGADDIARARGLVARALALGGACAVALELARGRSRR
jgi:adenosylcobinamide-phosphate synthase